MTETRFSELMEVDKWQKQHFGSRWMEWVKGKQILAVDEWSEGGKKYER